MRVKGRKGRGNVTARHRILRIEGEVRVRVLQDDRKLHVGDAQEMRTSHANGDANHSYHCNNYLDTLSHQLFLFDLWIRLCFCWIDKGPDGIARVYSG